MKRVTTIVNLILLTVIAGLVVDIFYNVIDSRVQNAAAADIQYVEEQGGWHETAQRRGFTSLARYQPIIRRDLFKTGVAPKSAVPEPEPAEGLEPTELDLRLWGTVTGKGPVKYAVIEAQNESRRREQDLYREGDTVTTATIERILDSKVILNVNGVRQVLVLEKFEQKGRRSSSYRRRRVSRRSTHRVRRRTISHRLIENASKNLNQILSQAKVIPQGDGMKITRIKPRSIFRRLGLRNGDVITSVNDRAIRSADEAMRLYQSLGKGSQLSIQLKRRNRPQTIECRIR